jgi:putative DNA primase/helicase
MEKQELERRVEEVKRRTYGRWPAILVAMGVDEKLLSKRNIPCPECGGDDRFQFTDRFSNGDAYCRGCGHWDGFKVAMVSLKLGFVDVLKKLEEQVGTMPAVIAKPAGSSPDNTVRMKKLAQRIWSEARPITAGDEVDRYLSNRGLQLAEYPKVLRFHPSLAYYVKQGEKSVKVAEYPAMLAVFQGPDGFGTTLHRTYLLNGAKAPLGRDAKKCLSTGVNGAAIRLFDPVNGELGVAEGIETALAVYRANGKPVWSAYSAGNLEKLWVPETVTRLCIYADNDAAKEFDGQCSAFILARRATKEANKLLKDGKRQSPLHVAVHVPKAAGSDWADVWFSRLATSKKAA